MGIIAKARFYLSSQTLMTLYYSHVYPFLTYCNVAWSSTYRSSVNCIYLLPKRLVRLITKPHYLAKTTPLFSRLKVLVKDWNDLPVTWAGNLIANFWKRSNPQPMHCLVIRASSLGWLGGNKFWPLRYLFATLLVMYMMIVFILSTILLTVFVLFASQLTAALPFSMRVKLLENVRIFQTNGTVIQKCLAFHKL